MSKYVKLEDAIGKIVNTPTRVITDDLTALADRQHEIIDMLADLPTIGVSEDCISKHDLWRIVEDNAYWVTYNETSKEKGMTLTGINQALNECPPVVPKSNEDAISREWVKGICEMMLDEEMLGHMLGYIEDAPSVVPQVPSEDCISRADAVNALIAHFIPQTYTGEEVEQASKLARKIMANAPSVVPSRTEGEWKITNTYKDHSGRVVDRVEHTDCGYIWNREMGEPLHNYCPNCGAKMKGAE